MVLLSAHLQGYIEDLFTESARLLLRTNVKDVDALIKQALSGFSNPHDYRIERLFDSIGLSKIANGLSWQKASNQSIRRRLTHYIEVRNGIAHGKQEGVHKREVNQFKQFVELFAKNFDDVVSNNIQRVTGKKPW